MMSDSRCMFPLVEDAQYLFSALHMYARAYPFVGFFTRVADALRS